MNFPWRVRETSEASLSLMRSRNQASFKGLTNGVYNLEWSLHLKRRKNRKERCLKTKAKLFQEQIVRNICLRWESKPQPSDSGASELSLHHEGCNYSFCLFEKFITNKLLKRKNEWVYFAKICREWLVAFGKPLLMVISTHSCSHENQVLMLLNL